MVCIIYLLVLKIFPKFPMIFGTEERTLLGSRHKCNQWQFLIFKNVLVTYVFLEEHNIMLPLEWLIKWENRMIRNQLITHVAFLFFFEIQYLFVNFISEESTFIPFITNECNNNCLWLTKNTKKSNYDKLDS